MHFIVVRFAANQSLNQSLYSGSTPRKGLSFLDTRGQARPDLVSRRSVNMPSCHIPALHAHSQSEYAAVGLAIERDWRSRALRLEVGLTGRAQFYFDAVGGDQEEAVPFTLHSENVPFADLVLTCVVFKKPFIDLD